MNEVKFPCFYYICMSEAINLYGKLTVRIATLALGFDPTIYTYNYHYDNFSLRSLCH